ncbi:MAG: hypothetical protein H6559_21425 [Lewinellaceae bacterium]|nr:hypothetical protein [Lewinellaceae bacterium]
MAFIAYRHHLPLLFNDEAPVLEFAVMLMLFAAVFQISDSVQVIGVGLLRGIQDVRIPTAFVALVYWGIGIPAGYALAFKAGWDIAGIWTGFVCGIQCQRRPAELPFPPAHQALSNVLSCPSLPPSPTLPFSPSPPLPLSPSPHSPTPPLPPTPPGRSCAGFPY